MSSPASAIDEPREVVPTGILGMALFIATEAMFFLGLISAFLVVLRAGALPWPPFDQPRLPVGITGINTAILLVSSWTMRRSVSALRLREGSLVRWMGVTALHGAIFLSIQGVEWIRLVGFGLTTTSSLYGATFYMLVGIHGVHVASAVVALMIFLARAADGRYAAGDEARLMPMAMYWYFVVAIWPILYLLVYLR
jgi:heme/copper-type cytochrome/quinol oxidase subunit 3